LRRQWLDYRFEPARSSSNQEIQNPTVLSLYPRRRFSGGKTRLTEANSREPDSDERDEHFIRESSLHTDLGINFNLDLYFREYLGVAIIRS